MRRISTGSPFRWGVGIIAVALCARADAQRPTSSVVTSIGQPPRVQFDASVNVPVHGSIGGAPQLGFALYRSVTNPVTGLLGATAEPYLATSGSSGGTRLMATSKLFAVSMGVDWSWSPGRVAPIISYATAIRRGGILGGGTMVRVDWLPTRSQALSLGLSVPVFRPLAGRTRPRTTDARLANANHANPEDHRAFTDPSRIGQGDSVLRNAASTLAAFGNAYSRRASSAIAQSTGGYAEAIRRYDDEILRLFRLGGIDSVLCGSLLAKARTIMLDEFVLPVDSLFGQAKHRPRDVTPLVARAGAAFTHWMSDSLRLEQPHETAAAQAFDRWLDAIAGVYQDLLTDVGDARLAWLPLDLAVEPSELDNQAYADSLIARVVGHPFTDENALTYLRSTDLPLEIARSIYAARRYHVLWTHDFTGRRESGAIDNVAYRMVADAYLPALTAAVKRYDSTGVFPTYLILQDEFFYEARDDRLWLTILENPLHASVRLRGDTSKAREAHLLARQTELRNAVAASTRLQRDAGATGRAEDWLQRTVKVHVNVVEPSDFSFRSAAIIPGLPFTPDNIMRDHRKLVLYDLTEADPYRGAMLIMGVGIGEHYASATWEDRGYRVRGPVALDARRAVRDVLVRHGIDRRDIPAPLQSDASGRAVEQRADATAYVGRALLVQNDVGFGRKESSVARAMLYNLAPTGSVIIVPDPMWLSDTWAGMLVGAAARGCRVYVIAPSEANAPSPQSPLMALQRDVLSRVLVLRRSLASAIRASGGELRVGIFAAKADVEDIAGRRNEIRDGLAREPGIREVIPFDNQALMVLQRAERTIASEPKASAMARDEVPRAPQLHQKSQLIARPGAIATLVRQPGWDVALADAFVLHAEESARFAQQLGYTNPNVDTTATRRTDALLRGYEAGLPKADRRRTSFYFSLGTQNQDPRGIVSDAEATLVVSGVGASAGLVDLFYLMARSTWLTSEKDLDPFLRPRGQLLTRISRFARAAF